MINRFKPDYFRMVPDNESGEFVYFWQHMDAIKAAKESIAPPVNPDTTARLVEALRAIVDWENRESDYTIPVRLINDANNALHMAQLPVVPVSEDVETIRRALKTLKELQFGEPEGFAWLALAALDRLAAAAGRHSHR